MLRPRGETEWLDLQPTERGTAEPTEPAPRADYPAAVLWLPDPDAWYGWTIHRVDRDTPKGTRRLGFGRRD